MLSPWLKIPHFLQTRDGRCLEACVRAVLAHWQYPVSEEQLCQLFESSQFGTPASRVLRLKQWGFEVIYGPSDVIKLQTWLAQGVPIIALVQTEFLDYATVNTPHAVVVIGLTDQQVYLQDPMFEQVPQIASLNGFLAAWLEMDETIAKNMQRQ